MSSASETSTVAREQWLLEELELVRTAVERGVRDQSASQVSEEWLAKLQQWRNELEALHQNLSNRAA